MRSDLTAPPTAHPAPFRAPRRALRAALAVAMLAACDRSSEVPRAETAVALPTPGDTVAAPAAPVVSGWTGDAGPALFVVGERAGEALVIVPAEPGGSTDSTPAPDSVPGAAPAVLPVELELFSRAGGVARARATASSRGADASSCAGWPKARVERAGGDEAPAWTVGFAASGVSALPLDSIEALSPPDSARLAAEVTRLASSLPGDTAASFRALPYHVRSARRFSPAEGVTAVVATLTRSVNQEAKPLGEQLLVIAERPATGADARFAVAYHERSSGREETLESAEPLAAVLLGAARRPTLVLGRDYYDGSAYSLVERTGPGRWRVRWTSAYGGC
jgi:hypothetical protein